MRFGDLPIWKKITIGFLILNLVVVMGLVGYLYHVECKYTLRKMEASLLAGSYRFQQMIGDDFHDDLPLPPKNISSEAYDQLIIALSDHVRSYGMAYAYTVFKDKDNFCFAMSSVDPEDIAKRQFGHWGDIYKRPSEKLKLAFDSQKVVFEKYTDEFGTFHSAFIPMKNRAGVPYVLGVDMKAEVIHAQIIRVLANASILAFGVFFMSGILIFFMTTRIARPVSQLCDFTRALVATDFNPPPKLMENLQKIPRRGLDEIGCLVNTITRMQQAIGDYVERIRTEITIKERMQSELRVAAEIQNLILPPASPDPTTIQGLEYCALIDPAREVGGDFFDYLKIDENRFFFVIGDVSGKGVPSALVMAVCKTLIHTFAIQEKSPADILCRVNHEISTGKTRGMFVTILCGILNLRDGTLIFANAGHFPPLILSKDGAVPNECASRADMPLGILATTQYHNETVTLHQGDTLLLYTDGITEAKNSDGDMFGSQRLLDACQSISQSSAHDMIETLRAQIGAFVRDEPQSDDITLVALRYMG